MWIYGRIPDADAPDAHTPFAVRLLLEDGAIVHHAFDSVPEDLAIGDRIVTLLPGRATRQPA